MNLEIVFGIEAFHIDLHPGNVEQVNKSQLAIKMLGDSM